MRLSLPITVAGALAAFYISVSAQQAFPALTPVRAIQPPVHPLPPESATAGVTRFSFVVYGDTRCVCRVLDPLPPGSPAPISPLPGTPEQEPDHAAVIAALSVKVKALAKTPAPVKFVLQTGDAVYRGVDAAR